MDFGAIGNVKPVGGPDAAKKGAKVAKVAAAGKLKKGGKGKGKKKMKKVANLFTKPPVAEQPKV